MKKPMTRPYSGTLILYYSTANSIADLTADSALFKLLRNLTQNSNINKKIFSYFNSMIARCYNASNE